MGVFDGKNGERSLFYLEFYFVIGKTHTVDAFVFLIGRARVVGKAFDKPATLCLGDFFEKGRGKFHL